MHRYPRHCSAVLFRVAFALGIALLVAGLAVLAPTTFARQDPATGVTGVPDPVVRIVHASPDAPAIDLLLDGQPVAENIGFGTATAYAAVAPGDHQVQVVPTGESDPLIDQRLTLVGETAAILAVIGPVANLQFQVQAVDLGAIPPGQARLRVLHAVPDAPAIDVAVAGREEPLVGGVAFPVGPPAPAGDLASDGGMLTPVDGLGAPAMVDDAALGGEGVTPTVGGYHDVDAGTFDLEVRDADTGRVLGAMPGLRLDPGQAYDLVVLGQPGGGEVRLLMLETRVNVPCGTVLGIGQATEACLRVIHASPDAGQVDIYVGELLTVQGLAFGGSTEFAAAPSGQQQLRVVPAGGSLDQAVLDSTQDFGSGQAYQMTVSGLAAEGAEEPLTAWLAGVDLSPLPANQARVRVVHASPDSEAIDVSVAGGPTPFDAIAYGTQSGYVVFNAGSYGLQLRLDADDTLLREAPEVQIESGLVYDVYAIGQSEDGTLQLVVLAAEAGVQQGTVVQAGAAPAPLVASPAAAATPVVAVGATPVLTTPGAATPAESPTS